MANLYRGKSRAILTINVNPTIEFTEWGLPGPRRFEPGSFEIPAIPIFEDWLFERDVRNSMYLERDVRKFDLNLLRGPAPGKYVICFDGERPEYTLRGCFASEIDRGYPNSQLRGTFRWDAVDYFPLQESPPTEHVIDGHLYRLVR